MKVVVVGASGEIGVRVVERLRRTPDVEVVAAHRGTGVDAYRGLGLAEAFAGAEVVVDCLNTVTQKAKAAIDFFGTTARNIGMAAHAAGVPRVVCLSIAHATDPAVNAKFGYYQGKAAQEAAYGETVGDRLTVVASTQWYELAAQLMGTLRLGPVAAVPHMRCRPAAAADVADVLADTAVTGPAGAHVVEVAGPDVHDLAAVARAIAARDGSPRCIVGIRFGGPAIRNGGLIPENPDVVTATTLDQWLTADGQPAREAR